MLVLVDTTKYVEFRLATVVTIVDHLTQFSSLVEPIVLIPGSQRLSHISTTAVYTECTYNLPQRHVLDSRPLALLIRLARPYYI